MPLTDASGARSRVGSRWHVHHAGRAASSGRTGRRDDHDPSRSSRANPPRRSVASGDRWYLPQSGSIFAPRHRRRDSFLPDPSGRRGLFGWTCHKTAQQCHRHRWARVGTGRADRPRQSRLAGTRAGLEPTRKRHAGGPRNDHRYCQGTYSHVGEVAQLERIVSRRSPLATGFLWSIW